MRSKLGDLVSVAKVVGLLLQDLVSKEVCGILEDWEVLEYPIDVAEEEMNSQERLRPPNSSF